MSRPVHRSRRFPARDTGEFAAGGATAIVQGLGGKGKTRAAVEYALRHADEYTALLFLRAVDPAALDSQIAALAGVSRLAEDASPDDRVRRLAVPYVHQIELVEPAPLPVSAAHLHRAGTSAPPHAPA